MGDLPEILPLGLEGLLVRFDDKLSESGNAAALAFHRDVLEANWSGMRDVAPALTSVAIFYDPLALPPADLRARVLRLLEGRDWQALSPSRGRLWRIPVAFGGTVGPQLQEVAEIIGCSEQDAIAALCDTPFRVLTLGYAPGQPYLGTLPPAWNIPRQASLTDGVPAGALVVAVRQAVIFSARTQTGWRHVGQSSFRPFQPESDPPLRFTAGDGVELYAVPQDELSDIADLPDGGAEVVA